MADSKFPTEVVSLPSKGHFYSPDNPLSSGEIELKYMTAKEEDILTSQNLIKKGIVIDKLLESLVVSKDVKLDSMLIGDKNAIMVAARVLGYGKDYSFELDCPACGDRSTNDVDLTSVSDKKVDIEQYDSGKNEFEYELPASKRTLTFKFLTQKDERDINLELKALKKITSKNSNSAEPEVTTRLKKIIVSIDGDTDRSTINKFVDNEFLSIDSLSFRNKLIDITPDVDLTYNFECLSCSYDEEMTVPVTVRFFWPTAKR